MVHQSEVQPPGPVQGRQVQLVPEHQVVLGEAALTQQEHVVRPQRELCPGDVQDGQRSFPRVKCLGRESEMLRCLSVAFYSIL